MNILYISHERKMGGANCSLFELVREMKNRGHNVSVAVLYRGCPIDKKLRQEGIGTVSAFFGWWQQPAYWPRFMKWCFGILHGLQFLSKIKLSHYVKKNGIEIIHSNSSCIDIGMQVAKQTGVKHVWHFREYGDKDYNLEFIKGRKESLAVVNSNTDKVIFISEALKKSFADINGDGVAEVVYNGVSQDHISEAKKSSDTPLFLVAGNLSQNKNQMLVLEAVNCLKKRNITNFSVEIAGDSTSLQLSKLYKEELYKYIAEHELYNVKMLGYVSNMKELRQRADVEIVASVSEAFGRVTVESMLSHNPVIVSDAGANPELVRSKENGMIFQSKNAEDLARQMELCVKSPELVSEMGQRAYEYAACNFTISKNADKIENIYKSIL